MQTKLRSWIESGTYTIVGVSYAIPLNIIMLTHPTFIDIKQQSIWMTFVFTIIGLGLKYVTRRIFNWWDHKDGLNSGN